MVKQYIIQGYMNNHVLKTRIRRFTFKKKAECHYKWKLKK